MPSPLESLPLDCLALVYRHAAAGDRRTLLAALPRSHLRSTFLTAVQDPGVNASVLRRAAFRRLRAVTVTREAGLAKGELARQGIVPASCEAVLRFSCPAQAYWSDRALTLGAHARVAGIRTAYADRRASQSAVLALEGLRELTVVVEGTDQVVPGTTAGVLTVWSPEESAEVHVPALPGVHTLTLRNVTTTFDDATDPFASLPALRRLELRGADVAGYGPEDLADALLGSGVRLTVEGRYAEADMDAWVALSLRECPRFVGWLDLDACTVSGDVTF